MLIFGGADENKEDIIGGIEIKRGDRTEIANDRVITYLAQMNERKKQDKTYLPFDMPHRGFIKNLTLLLLRESKATYLIDELDLPQEYHCPRRLYYFLSTQYDDVPKYPPYTPVIAYCDAGIYEVIESITDMCKGIEKYYTEIYEYLVQKLKSA
jgi:hypothetical protein